MKRLLVALCALALVLTTSCGAVSTVIDSAVNSAANKAGKAVGEKVGEEVGKVAAAYIGASLAELTPALLQAYTKAVFMIVLYHGGYDLGVGGYEVGSWTRWTLEGGDAEEYYEKSFFSSPSEGSEWWRVEVHDKDEEGKLHVFVAEALFAAPPEGEAATQHAPRKLLRLRVKYPNKEKAEEVPVHEDEAGWTLHPRPLTKESLAGATEGTETVETGVGPVAAKRVRYGNPQGAQLWWLADGYPDGMVRFQRIKEGQPEGEGGTTDNAQVTNDQAYTLVLAATGKDATTSKLGVLDAPSE